MGAQTRAKLSPAELSSQEGVYYKGRAPGGDAEAPLLVPFTTSEVEELLERV